MDFFVNFIAWTAFEKKLWLSIVRNEEFAETYKLIADCNVPIAMYLHLTCICIVTG